MLHVYIAPELTHQDRADYWKDLLTFLEEQVNHKPECKVIITGDLNTRDRRFGEHHEENHANLNEILLTFNIISDVKVRK